MSGEEGEEEDDEGTKVTINIVRCTNIRNADVFDKSDPYCVCEVLGAERSTIRTKVAYNDLNPVWDHTAEVDWDGKGDMIFKVYDRDLITHDDLLGHAALPARLIWQGFSGSLVLETDAEAETPGPGLLRLWGLNPSATIQCCSCFSGVFTLGKPAKPAQLFVKVVPERTKNCHMQ
mmetsp:Transcript_88130/g.247889  ORF Transcript_88130/g.247889 Transcript_88130/m.247889 type:complete len:176 (+) Transcript_88130:58-585(+)